MDVTRAWFGRMQAMTPAKAPLNPSDSSAPLCAICGTMPAVYLCEDCTGDCVYCVPCEAAVHNYSKFAFHYLLTLQGGCCVPSRRLDSAFLHVYCL